MQITATTTIQKVTLAGTEGEHLVLQNRGAGTVEFALESFTVGEGLVLEANNGYEIPSRSYSTSVYLLTQSGTADVRILRF